MATPGSTTLYDTAATAAAERLKKERTYRSKVWCAWCQLLLTLTSIITYLHGTQAGIAWRACLCTSSVHMHYCCPVLFLTCVFLCSVLQARNILVTNWPMDGVPQLMESFSLFTPSGSVVTFVLPEEAPTTWPSRLANCRFNFTTAGENPTGVKVRETAVECCCASPVGACSCCD